MNSLFHIAFKGRKVLITGGHGFIGASLARQLVMSGATVRILDLPALRTAGNRFNLEPFGDEIEEIPGDIRDVDCVSYAVGGQDYVFHCASQMSHTIGLSCPFEDLQVNIEGTATLMKSIRDLHVDCVVVNVGTRGQYGAPLYLPVDESHPMDPKGVHEVSKVAAEHLVKIFANASGVPVVCARLSNIYGPRSQMRNCSHGVANWFVRLALDRLTIPLFGKGTVTRDFLYISDCVDALLHCAHNPTCHGEAINIGAGVPTTFQDFASAVVSAAGTGSIECVRYTEDRQRIEPGDVYLDISKICNLTGWRPVTSVVVGISETVKFYQEFSHHYW